jgi:hypothetical protein
VFPSTAAFGAYVGSVPPGNTISVEYVPAGGGPQRAKRVSVAVGGSRMAQGSAQDRRDTPAASGMSTGSKVAIGVGAATLFACYEVGCFSRTKTGQAVARPHPMSSGFHLQR